MDIKYGLIFQINQVYLKFPWVLICIANSFELEWIKATAEELGLQRDQLFTKKEATPEDIAVILRTLWLRADDIPCSPIVRLAFRGVVLLSGLDGFRPGVLMDLKYSQVAIDLVRIQENQVRLVITFTLYQNKQGISVIRTGQSNV